MLGFGERRVLALARAAGVRYRTYVFHSPQRSADPDYRLYFPATGGALVAGPAEGVPTGCWRAVGGLGR